MNELTYVPLIPYQIYQEINYLSSDDRNETKIRDLIKDIHHLRKEDNENFQKLMELNIEDLTIKLRERSPRLAWKFSKAVPNYPNKDTLLTSLSQIFVIQKLFQKSCKVINANDNIEQKEIAIEFLLDFLLRSENNKQVNSQLIIDVQKTVNHIFSYKNQEKLYSKIYELSKLLNTTDTLPKVINDLIDTKDFDPKIEKKKPSEHSKEPKKRVAIRELDCPKLLEISEMISNNKDISLNNLEIKLIRSNFRNYLKNNPINITVLDFLGSIDNKIIKNKLFKELLKACKQSKDIDTRILCIDLLRIEKKFAKSDFIIATLYIIKKIPNREIKDKYLIELFKKINWLFVDYTYTTQNILEACKNDFMKEVFQEFIDSRLFYKKLCDIVRKSHPELVAKMQLNILLGGYQGECLTVLQEFIKELLVLAGKDDSNCDFYLKSDSGREMFFDIISTFVNKQIENKKFDSDKNTLYQLVHAYESGGLTLEDFEESLKSTTIPIDKSLLDEILLIENKDLKIAAFHVLHSMLTDTYISEEVFYDYLEQKRLSEDFFNVS